MRGKRRYLIVFARLVQENYRHRVAQLDWNGDASSEVLLELFGNRTAANDARPIDFNNNTLSEEEDEREGKNLRKSTITRVFSRKEEREYFFFLKRRC